MLLKHSEIDPHSPKPGTSPDNSFYPQHPPLGLSSLKGTAPSIPLKNVGEFKAMFLPQSGGFAFIAAVM